MWNRILIKFLVLYWGTIVSSQVATNFTSGANVPGACLCATSGFCDLAGGGGSNDGSNMIDARILNTGGQINTKIIGTNVSLCQPVPTGISLAASNPDTCNSGLDLCCPDIGYTCGVTYPPINGAPKAAAGQAPYGSHPYQVAIFTTGRKYLGGGAIIDQFNIVTAAHIIPNDTQSLLIKIGYWDISSSQEPLDTFDMTTSLIMKHPNFTVSNLKNNIAVIRLPTALALGQVPNVQNICLPSALVGGIRCIVSGWGNVNSSTPVNIKKEVDLPIVNSSTCQEQLRKTRLKQSFKLDNSSFICAGGEAGKDACIGDGGSPLSCYIVDRVYLVGIVSWGVGCGQANVPGVYTNVFTYISWIQSTTVKLASSASSISPSPTKMTATTISSAAITSTTISSKLQSSTTSSLMSSFQSETSSSTSTKLPTSTILSGVMSTNKVAYLSTIESTVGSSATQPKLVESTTSRISSSSSTIGPANSTSSVVTSFTRSTSNVNSSTSISNTSASTQPASTTVRQASSNNSSTVASTGTRSGSTLITTAKATTGSENSGLTNKTTNFSSSSTAATVSVSRTTTTKSGNSSVTPVAGSTTLRGSSVNPTSTSKTSTNISTAAATSTGTRAANGTTLSISNGATKTPTKPANGTTTNASGNPTTTKTVIVKATGSTKAASEQTEEETTSAHKQTRTGTGIRRSSTRTPPRTSAKPNN